MTPQRVDRPARFNVTETPVARGRLWREASKIMIARHDPATAPACQFRNPSRFLANQSNSRKSDQRFCES
ncbi:MAG: hypothetical protein E5V89_13440 [Mesorhizobium sp.]|nr:MAG: hypothetical protein E5V89_13440 [Mesorhizobium sp.]